MTALTHLLIQYKETSFLFNKIFDSLDPYFTLKNFIFSFQVDPLVSLMMVEKVPDSTYEMVGGLDKQIKEIKEVCSIQ